LEEGVLRWRRFQKSVRDGQFCKGEKKPKKTGINNKSNMKGAEDVDKELVEGLQRNQGQNGVFLLTGWY